MTNSILGVDIGTGSVKIVEIGKEKNGLVLGAIGETKTPSSDWFKELAGGSEKKIDEMVVSVKLLMHDLKTKSKQVVTSLPEDEVISRLIKLPPIKDEEIMSALRFEAETFVPYPLDQVSMDYVVVDKDEMGRLTIFAIAAKNSMVESFVKLFKKAGLELVALESSAVVMRRAVSQSVADMNRGIIVVDLGEKFSDIVGLNNGNIYFTRTMTVGGESFTRAISINLGLDMASAEEYKKAYGMREMELEGKIRRAIEPVFTTMAEEIKRSMSLLLEEQKKATDLLVLSGGGANMPGLAEELTRILGVEVQVINPFTRVDTSRVVLPLNISAEGCRFTMAAGMAMRGLVE